MKRRRPGVNLLVFIQFTEWPGNTTIEQATDMRATASDSDDHNGSESDHYRPNLSDEGLVPARDAVIRNQYGEMVPTKAAVEVPLTIKIADEEIVTLMTLGTMPEKLVLGYLRNQRLVDATKTAVAHYYDVIARAAQRRHFRHQGIDIFCQNRGSGTFINHPLQIPIQPRRLIPEHLIRI